MKNFRRSLVGAAAGLATFAAVSTVPASVSMAEPLLTNGIRLFGAKAPKPAATMKFGCPGVALATGVVSDKRHAVVNGVQGAALCIGLVSAGAMVGGPAGALVGGLAAGVIGPAVAAGQKRRLQR